MTLLSDATEQKKYDTRVIERNVQRGITKAEDHEKFQKELADDADNAEYVNVDTLVADTNN
jgi:hypothetical protein